MVQLHATGALGLQSPNFKMGLTVVWRGQWPRAPTRCPEGRLPICPADAPRAAFLSAPLAAPARLPRPTVSRTLLFPSVQGEHVRGMADEQQQAEWHPHLGSLVRAGAGLLAPRLDGPAATRRRGARGGFSGLSWRIRRTRGRSHRQEPTVSPGAGLQVE